jgi:hypothetical protein
MVLGDGESGDIGACVLGRDVGVGRASDLDAAVVEVIRHAVILALRGATTSRWCTAMPPYVQGCTPNRREQIILPPDEGTSLPMLNVLRRRPGVSGRWLVRRRGEAAKADSPNLW